MLTTLVFIIVLAILIFVHELGHFLAARASGIRVDAFMLGFGPRVYSWKRGETEYGLNLIPFGGYVKIFGENPDTETLSGPHASRSMVNKPRWKQIVVLVAGVSFNFIFAWILYSIVFMYGVTASKEGFEKYTQYFSDQRIMITSIAPASPAEKAGIVMGDTIQRVVATPSTSTSALTSTSTPTNLTISSIQQFVNGTQGSPLDFIVIRKGESRTIHVTPVTGLIPGAYAVGIGMDYVGNLKLPVFSAVWVGLQYTGAMMHDMVSGLWTLVVGLFHGAGHLSDVSGPVGIAGIVGDAAERGFAYLLMITALISINLGVINLIPFPALDGGRVLFILIEAVIRRRIPERFTNAVNTVGFILLMLLMVVVTYKDIAKLVWG